MYKFDYTLDDKDFIEINSFHYDTAPESKKALLQLRLICLGVLIFLFMRLIVNTKNQTDTVISVITCVVISLIWIIAAKPLFNYTIKKKITAMIKKGKIKYNKNITVHFGEDEILEVTENTQSENKYPSIDRIAENAKFIFIYYDSARLTPLPLSVFETEEQKNEVLAFIETKRAEAAEQTEQKNMTAL